MAKHTPPDDNSFQLSLVKHVGAAIALVAVVAAAFWGVGQMQATEPIGDPVIASSPEPARTNEDPADVVTDEPTAPSTESEPAPEATAEPTSEASAEPTAAAPSPTPAPEPSPTATTPASSGAFDPADISVQVLDAVLDDAGEASKRVAEQLKADGYRFVARNQAVKKYDVTTVMYSPGSEAKARQIAEQYGYTRVEPQPGNLSTAVDVHLVVGADA